MCIPKEEAKTLAERLVHSMDRLTATIERLEKSGQRTAPLAAEPMTTWVIRDGLARSIGRTQ